MKCSLMMYWLSIIRDLCIFAENIDNTKNNMAHILECYKQQVLLHMLQQSTRDDAQEIERLVMAAADQVCEEMITYFESHQNELDLDQHTP